MVLDARRSAAAVLASVLAQLAIKMDRKDKSEVPWLEFLKLWLDLGIGDRPGSFDIMEGHPEGANKNAWGGSNVEGTAGQSFCITQGEDFFIGIHFANRLPYQFLRYSTAKTPGAPPGYTVKNVRRIKTQYDRAQMEAFAAAAESCTQPPLPSPAELAETAARLSASPAEIALIWLAGLNVDSYEHNFLPADLRGPWPEDH